MELIVWLSRAIGQSLTSNPEVVPLTEATIFVFVNYQNFYEIFAPSKNVVDLSKK